MTETHPLFTPDASRVAETGLGLSLHFRASAASTPWILWRCTAGRSPSPPPSGPRFGISAAWSVKRASGFWPMRTKCRARGSFPMRASITRRTCCAGAATGTRSCSGVRMAGGSLGPGTSCMRRCHAGSKRCRHSDLKRAIGWPDICRTFRRLSRPCSPRRRSARSGPRPRRTSACAACWTVSDRSRRSC